MFSISTSAAVVVGLTVLTASTAAFAQQAGSDFPFSAPAAAQATVEYAPTPGTYVSLKPSRRARAHYTTNRAAAPQGNVKALAAEIAQEHGVSVPLVHAVMHVESGGNCRATSSANARGAMQVKPATARGVGVTGNLHDCRIGITAGVRYLKQALAVNGGNICAAASSYNTGLGIKGRCSGYGRKVMAQLGRSQWASLD